MRRGERAGPARVLLATAAPDRGGAEAAMEHIARRLAPDRYRPIMAAPDGSPLLAAWTRAGFETLGTRPVRRLRHLGDTRGTIRALAAALRERAIDLVHTNGVATQIHAGIAARRAHRPVVSHVRDIFDT